MVYSTVSQELCRDSGHTYINILPRLTLIHNFNFYVGTGTFIHRYPNFPFISIVKSKSFAYPEYRGKGNRNKIDISCRNIEWKIKKHRIWINA